jgi:hypothetical protein
MDVVVSSWRLTCGFQPTTIAQICFELQDCSSEGGRADFVRARQKNGIMVINKSIHDSVREKHPEILESMNKFCVTGCFSPTANLPRPSMWSHPKFGFGKGNETRCDLIR